MTRKALDPNLASILDSIRATVGGEPTPRPAPAIELVEPEPASIEDDERPLAHRYLGPELGDAYVAATTAEPGPGNVLVRMRPERWTTVDYRKEWGGGG